MKYDSLSRARSIRVRLSLVFLFLFLLVAVLGVEAFSSLNYVNDAAAQIRNRWLPSTRALGDLNNFTTDFPAADAILQRAASSSERAGVLQQCEPPQLLYDHPANLFVAAFIGSPAMNLFEGTLTEGARSVRIDADYGRINIQDYTLARAFDEVADAGNSTA